MQEQSHSQAVGHRGQGILLGRLEAQKGEGPQPQGLGKCYLPRKADHPEPLLPECHLLLGWILALTLQSTQGGSQAPLKSEILGMSVNLFINSLQKVMKCFRVCTELGSKQKASDSSLSLSRSTWGREWAARQPSCGQDTLVNLCFEVLSYAMIK